MSSDHHWWGDELVTDRNRNIGNMVRVVDGKWEIRERSEPHQSIPL